MCSVDSKMLIFRAFSSFRGSNSMFELRLDRSRFFIEGSVFAKAVEDLLLIIRQKPGAAKL